MTTQTYSRKKVIDVEAHFWSRVDVKGPDECWLWKGSLNKPDGYGVFPLHRKNKYAHRMAYELTYGPIPEGFNVCHNCPGGDTPRCCNPKHLFTGTQAENIADMIRKGRHTKGRKMSPEHCLKNSIAHSGIGVKLNKEKVLQIKSLIAEGMSNRKLAAQFGVAAPTISGIRSGKIWRTV